MKCPQCNAEPPIDAKFCPACGGELTLVCPICGTENSPSHKFCMECGRSLVQGVPVTATFTSPDTYTPKYLAERILTSKAALEGERKQVTVLFADLKGSMELLSDRDPEDARAILDNVLTQMMDAVHRYEGTVNQVMGDGIMALFGAPLALEDHALRACYAALAMQEAIKAFCEETLRTYGVQVQIRVGLNSGEVVVRTIGNDLRMDYSAIGQTTHLAARMEQTASPGTVHLTPGTLHLVEGFVQVTSLGPVPIKGVAEPIEVFELTGAVPARTRFHTVAARGLTRFIGRGVELETLRRVIYRAGDGHGQILAVMGEAGVGKSRLYWEFTRSHRTKEWMVIESGSVSYGKATAYLPLVNLLKGYFRIEEGDDHRRIRERVTGKLLTLDESLTSVIPPVLSLLRVPVEDEEWKELDPPLRRQRTLDGIKHILLCEAQVQPLIVVFEDLHWIDSETQAFLDVLVGSLPGSRVLLLVNYRPEYEHGWAQKTYYTRLKLDPLSTEGAKDLLHAILGVDETLDSLKDLLIERTEGNPFFLEECVQTLIESGALAGAPKAYKLVEEVSEIHVPSTVHAILAARLDRLPPEEKALLQTASVIGMHIPFPLLSSISEMAEEELQRCLSSLQGAEFLYETSFFPEREFTFKHALTQEVAYESLLASRRQELHAAAGQALESLYMGRLEEVYDRLAHHFSMTDNTAKAVEYLERYAGKTAAIYAHTETLKSLQEALVHTDRLPPEERDHSFINLIIRQAESLHYLGRRQDIIDLLLRHRERLEQLGDPAFAGQYYYWLGWAHAWLGHRAEAARFLSRSLEEATDSSDEAIMGRVHSGLTIESLYWGPFTKAVEHGRQAVALLERGENRLWLCQAILGLIHSYYWTGDFERALASAARLDTVSENIASRRFQTLSAMLTGLTLATRGDGEAGVEACERALKLSPDPFETAWVLACLGKAYLEAGDADRAVPTLEQAVELGDQVRSQQFRALFRCFLGEAYLSNWQIEKARKLIGEALTLSTEIKYLLGLGLSQCALGRIATAQEAPDEAEGHLGEAIQIFTSGGARFEVGRIHFDLAVLAHTRGNPESAAGHLREAHSIFEDLRVPKYVDRAGLLAKEFGVHLSGQIAH